MQQGCLDEKVRPGYQNIRTKFKIKADAEAEELKDLFKYSPVHNSIRQPVNVDAAVEILTA